MREGMGEGENRGMGGIIATVYLTPPNSFMRKTYYIAYDMQKWEWNFLKLRIIFLQNTTSQIAFYLNVALIQAVNQ
jgi:hypothetical protein